jgi:prepilin-type N-terminal cleavage/methylation domain-containing protein
MIKRAAMAAGFTLIEMAIVVVVIGLLLSGGIAAVTPVVQGTKVSETKSKLDRVEQALVLHVIRFGCLPCPATPGTASTVATAGQADAGGTYTTGCDADACTNAQGVVPWVNLDLSETDASDSFDARFSYAITAGLQNANSMVRTPPATYPTGTLVVNNTTPVQITAAAAYVLISHGPDRAYGFSVQTGIQGGADAGPSTPQLANSNGTPFVQDDVIQLPGTTFFDDIVRWRSAPFIIQLCGANACGNPA